jgi:magnesium chelatase subunit D
VPSDQRTDDLIIDALDAQLPEGLLTPPNRIKKVADRSGRRRRDSIEKTQWRRGRYVRAVSKSSKTDSIALAATVRAAAPFQLRRKQGKQDGAAIRVAPSDLRFKQFKQKAGVLIIFAVDASGSMALNRISQAKGALIRLLQEAYIHRDHVALISFRDDHAELLLPPSRSVESARRALQSLAVGGATPLAAGLFAVLDLVRSGQHKDRRGKLLVLFTDGRANVACAQGQSAPARRTIWKELERAGCALQYEGVASVVIDTQRPLLASGEGVALAELLGARYVCLPHTDANSVHETVTALTGAMRR